MGIALPPFLRCEHNSRCRCGWGERVVGIGAGSGNTEAERDGCRRSRRLWRWLLVLEEVSWTSRVGLAHLLGLGS